MDRLTVVEDFAARQGGIGKAATLYGLFDEFEKIAVLYDPRVHNTPEKLERLRRTEELALQNRMRRVSRDIPVKRWGVTDAPKLLGENPMRGQVMAGGYWTEPQRIGGRQKAVVYAPRGIAEKVAPATASLNPAARRMAKSTVMHHELDEGASMLRKLKDKGHSEADFAWGPKVSKTMEKSLPKPLRAPAKALYAKGTSKLPESVQKALRAAGELPAQTAQHMDPSIIIQESNRVARLDPAAREHMMKLRKGTKERELFRRHGLRYGEEFIPESGRRYEKLRGKIISEADRAAENKVNFLKSLEGVERDLGPKANKLRRDILSKTQRVGEAGRGVKYRVKEMVGRLRGRPSVPAPSPVAAALPRPGGYMPGTQGSVPRTNLSRLPKPPALAPRLTSPKPSFGGGLSKVFRRVVTR